MTEPNKNIGTKLTELRYELTAAQAKLTDLARVLRANGLLDTPMERDGLRITGYRRVRGSHGESYVRDTEGADHLPSTMQAPPG